MDSISRLSTILLVAAAVIIPPAPVQAQQGTITGQVTDAETGEPLAGAAVEALGQGGPQGTNDSGRFSLSVPPGTYSVVVTFIGHETTRVDGIGVGAGETTELTISMRSQALLLNPVVITASRRQEKALDAPASITTVSASEVARNTATTVADHVRSVVGVDAAQTGIASGTLVARGFNNVFSGALLTIIDNRYARIPSLRFNAYSLFPTNDLDIDRIEVSLGPGAALYGPNASNGVMHVVTPSPIDRQGTTISLTGGERSFFHGQFRSAHSVSEGFGLKVSGQYSRGNDWEYVDPQEVVARDYFSERYSADARMDFRFGGDGELIVNGGTSTLASGVEMTGIGAAQADGWGYNYGQMRLTKGRLFAQAFLNQTNSGGQPGVGEGTVLLRTNEPVVDESRTMALQFQYGFDLGSWQSFTYGVDWQRTEPRSGGTIFGRNEDDDIITEIGTYLHSETSLGDKVDLVTAIRVDDHDRLTDVNISPRAALVLKPTETQNFRFTFNRAFATPTSTNLFLDIVAAQIPLDPLPLAYNVRALGVPDGGFTFSAQCPGGVMGYCMRSPFAPGPIPANALVLWEGLLQMLPALDPRLALVIDFLKMPGALPGDPEIGTVFRRLNQAAVRPEDAFPIDDMAITDIGDLSSTINNTFEVGYKGLLGNRVLLAADVYFSRIENFVGPLRVITPNVFFDPATLQQFVTGRLAPLIQAGLLSAQDVATIVGTAAGIPLGTVVPDQVDSGDLLVTYRNFGEVEFFGADLSAEILASDRFSINANYSFSSDECFDFNEDGDCTSTSDIALNAPSHKGSLGLTYDDQVSGFTAQGRFRFTDGFPMNSGVYVGTVDGYSVMDASIGYRLPFQPSTHVSLTANNILNNMHREFVGAPEVGRLLLFRVRYDF